MDMRNLAFCFFGSISAVMAQTGVVTVFSDKDFGGASQTFRPVSIVQTKASLDKLAMMPSVRSRFLLA